MMIQAATDRDADSIALIYNHYVHAGGSTFDDEPWTIAQARYLLSNDDAGIWLVATEHPPTDAQAGHPGVVCGWASARRFSSRHGYRYALETAVYVDAHHHGRGIGSELMQALIARCQQNRIHHLLARVISGNDASLNFHQRLGFEIVGTQKEVGQMEGHWLDVVLLQRLI